MGVGSSRVARSNSRKQPSQPNPEPVVPILTTSHPSPPTLPTVVRSRNKYGIDERDPPPPAPPQLPAKSPRVHRSQSTRSPESAARITERHAQRVRRAYGSEGGQFFQQQRSMTVPAAQPLRNPLPLPPKDYISKADFSRIHYSNPRPFVPVAAEDLIRSKTKGKGKVDATAGRDVFVARADEPSSSFSSHSSASTTNPPQQVITTPFGVLYGQQQQAAALQDPDHDKAKAKGGLFSSLFHSRRHSRSTSQAGHDPNASSITRRPSMQQSTSTAHPPISSPYMLAPRGAQPVPPPPPFYFYHPEAPGYGFTTFSPHKILYRKQLYPTAEHLYQSMKFLPSKGKGGDPALAERIRTISEHPAQAVLEGRQLNKHARPDWKEMRTKWMDEIMYMKFAQHPSLRHELINTHPSELIFASPHDPFWGVGPNAVGRNELGHSLGRVRTRILREMGR